MNTSPDDLTPEQRLALDNFANLSKAMALKMDQHNELAEKRKQAGRVLKDLGVGATVMAKAAEISVQAVYKLLQAKGGDQ
jgi:hypothetical protein